MKNLQKLCTGLLFLAVSSIYSFGLQSPAKANITFDVRYACTTRHFRIETDGSRSGKLQYIVYSGVENLHESTPDKQPDIVLGNGRAYFQSKNRVVMQWKDSEGDVHQLILSGAPNKKIVLNDPYSGRYIVKRGRQTIINQQCYYLHTFEVTQ
ncbi:MAG TPA: hypothetical protein VK184_22790 [Nostocaceae cyanobacterium]|nr:hypothetical protein [Nostocaceae cyanobacterium]